LSPHVNRSPGAVVAFAAPAVVGSISTTVPTRSCHPDTGGLPAWAAADLWHAEREIRGGPSAELQRESQEDNYEATSWPLYRVILFRASSGGEG